MCRFCTFKETCRVCVAVKYTVYNDVEDKYACIFQFESNHDPLYKLGVPDISVNRENKLEISPFRPFFPSPWLTGVWQPIKALYIHSSSRGRTGTIFIVTVVGTYTHIHTHRHGSPFALPLPNQAHTHAKVWGFISTLQYWHRAIWLVPNSMCSK